MAWTLDNYAAGTATATTNPVNLAFTTGTGAKLLIVAIWVNGGSIRTAAAPTFGGDSAVDSGTGAVFYTGGGTECNLEVWYILDPYIGAGTISVGNSGALPVAVAAASFIPGSGACELDSQGDNNGDSANPSVTWTVGSANCLVYASVASGYRTVPTAGSGYTMLSSLDAGNQVWGDEYDLDVGAAGSKTAAFVLATDDWGMITLAFKETSAGVTIQLDTAVITASGKAITPAPGSVTKALDAALITASQLQATITAPIPSVQIQLDTATLTASGQAATISEGAVTTNLDTASITATGQTITISSPGSAVTRTGSLTLIQDSAQSNSQSITVPSDAEICVVVASLFKNSLNWIAANPFTLAGSNLTTVQKTDEQTTNGHVWIGYKTNPTTGSQTLAWDWGAALEEGANILVAFYKNIDLTDPIASSGQQLTAGSDLTGLTASAGDMMVGGLYSYSTITSVTDNSQTELQAPTDYNLARFAAAEKDGGTGFYYTGGGYQTCAALVINKSSGIAVALNAATLTATGQTLTPQPGEAAIALSAGSLTASGQAATIAAPITIGLATALITTTGQALTPAPGTAAVALSAATLTVTGQTAAIVAGAAVISLDLALLTAQADAATISLVTKVNLNVATLTATGMALTAEPGTVSTALNTATITATGQTITIGAGSIIQLDTATITASALAIGVEPGSVTTALNAAALTASGQALSPAPGPSSVALDQALIQALGQTLGLTAGQVFTQLDAALLQALGKQIYIGAAGAPTIVSLDQATLTATGQALAGVVGGPVSISLDPAALTAAGMTADLVPGTAVISLDLAQITATELSTFIITIIIAKIGAADFVEFRERREYAKRRAREDYSPFRDRRDLP